jgi:hypothetical protein
MDETSRSVNALLRGSLSEYYPNREKNIQNMSDADWDFQTDVQAMSGSV